MTRDEAIKVFVKCIGYRDESWGGHWIDALESLGILKLDEPKRESLRLTEQINARCSGFISEDAVCRALDSANIRLVTKPEKAG